MFVHGGANTDWWVPHYPADNMQRPTGPLCDGAFINYDAAQDGDGVEWREESWSGRGQPARSECGKPGAAECGVGDECLPAMSFAGTAAEQSDRRAVL